MLTTYNPSDQLTKLGDRLLETMSLSQNQTRLWPLQKATAAGWFAMNPDPFFRGGCNFTYLRQRKPIQANYMYVSRIFNISMNIWVASLYVFFFQWVSETSPIQEILASRDPRRGTMTPWRKTSCGFWRRQIGRAAQDGVEAKSPRRITQGTGMKY